MKIFKQLNKKGYKHYYEGTVEELDSMDKDNQHLHSEIMQVIMWLYEKHGVWINVDSDCYGVNWYSHILPCSKQVYHDLELRNKVYKSRFFIDASKTPAEAYSNSIKYCLTELI